MDRVIHSSLHSAFLIAALIELLAMFSTNSQP